VGREATLSADVRACNVSISGDVSGKIRSTGRIEMFKKSRVNGDLMTPELYMEEGSFFNGTCIMDEKLKNPAK